MRLFIVDKGKPLCDAMAEIFSEEADISIVGTAVSVRGAMPYLKDCDLVLVTADLPSDGALEVARAAAAQEPAVQVVLMDWAGSQETAYQYASAGVAAYALEDDSIEEMLEKMRAVHKSQSAESTGSAFDLSPEERP